VDLGAEAREALARELRHLGATHALLSECPCDALAEWLREACPGTRMTSFDSPAPAVLGDRTWWDAWLGIDHAEPGFLPDIAPPVYRGKPILPFGAEAPPVVALITGPPCSYRVSLVGHPDYADLVGCGVPEHHGCAFCSASAAPIQPFRTSPLDLALRQVASATASDGSCRSRNEFLLESSSLLRQLDRFVAGVRDLGVRGARFFLATRADDLLRCADRIEAALRLAGPADLSIHVVSMGAENFSDQENRRLNKGIVATQLREALGLMRHWEREHAGAFAFDSHGGLGFVLFTPWTTLQDLETNLRAARELGLGHAGFLLTRRLMLMPDLPVTRLAERDGLLGLRDELDVDVFGWMQRHCDPGCRQWPADLDIPWRFRDRLVACVFAVLVRATVACATTRPDPLQARMSDALRASPIGDDRLALFERVLDAAKDLVGMPTVQALADTLLVRVQADGRAPAGGAGAGADTPMLHTLRSALARQARAGIEPCRGFVLSRVETESDSPVLRLVLDRRGEQFVVLVGPASLGRWYLVRGRIGVGFASATPCRSADHVAVMSAVACAVAPRSERT
jgi:hypothetical protein